MPTLELEAPDAQLITGPWAVHTAFDLAELRAKGGECATIWVWRNTAGAPLGYRVEPADVRLRAPWEWVAQFPAF